MIKYEDEEGCRHLLRDIQVLYSEQKYYAGILSRKYACSVIVEQKKQDFTLFYYPETNHWDMVLPVL